MKIIKVYEGFLDKMYEKLPETKLAMALADFMNSINPELKCKYKRNSDGLWIITQNDTRLMYLEIFTEDVQLTFFAHHTEELTDDILDFLFYVFNTEIVDANVYKVDMSEIINKLTKEKYDDFLRGKDSNKYNL